MDIKTEVLRKLFQKNTRTTSRNEHRSVPNKHKTQRRVGVRSTGSSRTRTTTSHRSDIHTPPLEHFKDRTQEPNGLNEQPFHILNRMILVSCHFQSASRGTAARLGTSAHNTAQCVIK